jgi:hypothetical protein
MDTGNIMKLPLVITFIILLLTGCTTSFRNPFSVKETDKPTIRIVQQGSIPASSVYRQNFYIIGSNAANARFFLTPEIIGEMVAGGLTVISDIADDSTEKYYDTLKNNYRWRTDVFISGVTNFTDEQIVEILEAGTRPQFDAQRPPTVGSKSFDSRSTMGNQKVAPVMQVTNSSKWRIINERSRSNVNRY